MKLKPVEEKYRRSCLNTWVQRLLYSNHTLRFRIGGGGRGVGAGKFEPFYRIIQKTKLPHTSTVQISFYSNG